MKSKKRIKPRKTLFRRIVNLFLGFLGVILFLLLVFLGFTQTSTFRNLLRDEIVSRTNETLNAELSIEKIDGSIFTSLIFRDTKLFVENDTLFSAKTIDIKISPLQILLRKIYLREIKLDFVNLSILENKQGIWNISSMTKDTVNESVRVPIDSSESEEFPFTIQVNNLELNNINFRIQSFDNINSLSTYPVLNLNDFRINEFSFAAQLAANMQISVYQLILKKFSGKTNVDKFNIHNFAGVFEFTSEFANVKKMNIVTDRTNIELGVRLDNANLLGGINLEDFKKYPMQIKLDADPFNFDDLSVFINGTRLLNGNPSMQLEAEGYFGDFLIKKLIVDHESTHFEINGGVKNLHIPKELFLDISIENSSANYSNAVSLLPESQLPEFKDLFISNFNVKFKGKPTVFHASVETDISDGHLKSETFLDVESDVMRYDIEFETNDLDLTPILAAPTFLTSTGSIRGEGTHPDELDAQLNILINSSKYKNLSIDELMLETYARYSVIDFDLNGKLNNSVTQFDGVIDFSQAEIPVYEISGQLDSLNLGPILSDTSLYTDLNFIFNADGQDLEIDNMIGEFKIDLAPSYYGNEFIDTASISLSLDKKERNRTIKLSSDFVDLNMEGEFSLENAFELLSYETSTISSIIKNKFLGLNPLASNEIANHVNDDLKIPEIVDTVMTIEYDFEFNDFQLIAIILGDDKLDISGSGSGTIENNKNNFSISNNLEIDYLLQKKNNKLLYISDLNLDMNFSRDNNTISFDNLFGTVSATGSKFFVGSPINNLAADIIFNESKLFYNMYGEFTSDLTAEFEGNLELSPDKQNLIINTLYVDYKNQAWENPKPINLLLTPDSTHVSDFVLNHESAEINFSGYLLENGIQNVELNLSNITGSVLNNFLSTTGRNQLDANLNLSANIRGSLYKPEISSEINVNDVTVGDINFGDLICKFDYKNNNIHGDIKFIDSIYTFENPLLAIIGNVPMDMDISVGSINLIKDDTLNIDISSTNFNLSAIGNLLPVVRNQSGLLFADLKVAGIFNDLNYIGSISLAESKFNFAYNNLDYGLSASLQFNGKDINIKNFKIENTAGTQYPGQLNGSGSLSLKGFSLNGYEIEMQGDLAVLSKNSKTVSPTLYGNLVVESDGKWILKKENKRTSIIANIFLKNTDITFVPEQNLSTGSKRNFIYNILVDSTKIDSEELKFQRLVSNEDTEEIASSITNENSIFDYNISVNIVDDAKLIFILAQTVNQRLIVNATGRMNFESNNNITTSQGAFNLLEGSKLEFFKPFTASGTIRFESDISNPFLDVTAVYRGVYSAPDDQTSTSEDVAVKLSLNGSLNDLNQNLVENPENIAIYVGNRNIDNNVADKKYDASDAITFLILNIFKSDLTAADRETLNNTVSGATTSLLGPLLTNIINSEIGDIINDIQLSRVGEYTRFQVSGRYQKFRYSLGGNQEVFQNIENANIKFEFPLIFQLFVRLERRDPYISYTQSTEGKINELGFKYRFEF